MEQYKCEKCKHIWYARSENKPMACPKCKRYDWDIKNKEEKKNG